MCSCGYDYVNGEWTETARNHPDEIIRLIFSKRVEVFRKAKEKGINRMDGLQISDYMSSLFTESKAMEQVLAYIEKKSKQKGGILKRLLRRYIHFYSF